MLIALILSVVQALTEFLPISSSAHLAITPWLFNFTNYGLGFDAALHLGTALALAIYFSRDFYDLIRKRDAMFWYILIASIPAALVGFLADGWIERNIYGSSATPLVIGVGMLTFAAILYVVDTKASTKRTLTKLGFSDAFIVGAAQTLALIPGVSRSGITITAARGLGIERSGAARFSFLLATPITIGAGAYKTYQLLSGDIVSPVSNLTLVLSIILCTLVSLAVIRWLLGYLKNHNMRIFVYYRVVIAFLIIGVWLWRQ